MRVLILGGTGEARSLAAALDGRPDFEVTSSLAGRVANPALPVGAVRIGGFGGAAGLVDHLRTIGADVLVDATHPFAATISAHAAEAARAAGVPLVAVRRPAWTECAGDRWTRVRDIGAAAAEVAALPPGCVFVTTGRRDLAAFTADGAHEFLVRTVDPPRGPLPPRTTLLLARGPYTEPGEAALMRRHDVIALVTKDSGGDMTYAKLVAARERAIPVVMVDRPPLPPGVPTVSTVHDAISWLDSVAA
ncbi:MAG: cobalt-precorrin-6A reductase [Pseudonocardiales bacterium]|nr:cobalt-precorrin-6A reductase [Pseudonocardiales bacterium]